jgi:phage tail sheath protein FI
MNSSYSAVYWPWVKISDSYTKKDIWLPPSGFVAAQYAYNDKVGAPWLAPAGLNRGKMTKPIALEHSPTQGERDAMYGNRNVVNAIVNYLGDGIVIWGQKTTQRAPTALDRVNVRRLLNYLKKTISLSTRYFVFEQNNQATWDRWTNMVEPILRQVKERSGLNDYLIEINPTIWEIENNIMPATIKVKPTKSAEFIPIDFMIMPQSASFEV